MNIKKKIEIRHGIATDENAVARLSVSFQQFGDYESIFRALVRCDSQALARVGVVGEIEVYVAVLPGGQPVGFVATVTTTEHVDVLGVAVAESERRKGLAAQLLDHVCARAAVRDRALMKCTTAETNHAALRLFGSRGFVDSGVAGTYPRGQSARNLHRTADSSTGGDGAS